MIVRKIGALACVVVAVACGSNVRSSQDQSSVAASSSQDQSSVAVTSSVISKFYGKTIKGNTHGRGTTGGFPGGEKCTIKFEKAGLLSQDLKVSIEQERREYSASTKPEYHEDGFSVNISAETFTKLLNMPVDEKHHTTKGEAYVGKTNGLLQNPVDAGYLLLEQGKFKGITMSLDGVDVMKKGIPWPFPVGANSFSCYVPEGDDSGIVYK